MDVLKSAFCAGVSNQEIEEFGGEVALRGSQYSRFRLLSAAYPQHEWLPWKFVDGKVPKGYWDVPAHARVFFDWLAREKLGVNVLEDWYRVSAESVASAGNAGIISHRQGRSLFDKLQQAYPEHQFDRARFARSRAPPQVLGKDELDRLIVEGDESNLDRWYMAALPSHITGEMLTKSLAHHYPHHKWRPWLFRFPVPKGHWRKTENRVEYISWLCTQLHPTVQLQSALYSIRQRDFEDNGGAGLLQLYKGRVSEAIMSSFPQLRWERWRFNSLPKNYWQTISAEEARQFLEDLATKLRLPQNDLSAWYRVSAKQRNAASEKVLSRLDSAAFTSLLARGFPEHQWQLEKVATNRKLSGQAQLKNVLVAELLKVAPTAQYALSAHQFISPLMLSLEPSSTIGSKIAAARFSNSTCLSRVLVWRSSTRGSNTFAMFSRLIRRLSVGIRTLERQQRVWSIRSCSLKSMPGNGTSAA